MAWRAPNLEGDAARAVAHRGSHIQIIAAAGSGKTEVVSQRAAALLAEGVPAAGIVAFTFTERAADELRRRIAIRVSERLGEGALDRLGGLFVGTIHSYCFRLLQRLVPRYETYDVLDDNQLTAFISREGNRLEIRSLDPKGRLFAGISEFIKNVDVVENELLDPRAMPGKFGEVLRSYYSTLDRYRLLTYGQQVVRAVRELERAEVASAIHEQLRHLIVDEYQDINPAQERLIELLTGPEVELCVVGDDDQAIYQWRGSDVSNIVTFKERSPKVETFEITTNRRSRPQIIETANRFSKTIPGRIRKTMKTSRSDVKGTPQVVAWGESSEMAEAGWIANMILDLNEQGVEFKDIAVLVRSRAAYAKLVQQFGTFGIPVQPGGRTGLFDQPEAVVIGKTFLWLTDTEWRDAYGPSVAIDDDALLGEYLHVFQMEGPHVNRLRRFLREWKAAVPSTKRRADLVGELYHLIDVLEVRKWDLDDPIPVNRMGTLARFSALLADYESVRRRARPDPEVAGEQVGGEDRGTWYYRNLGLHIINYAAGAYEGFDGEADFVMSAVDLTTIHRAKGLEWPVVFVPSMTAKRFPSTRTGRPQSWMVPREIFSASRYEGSDADERRLFYVAITRARDWLSVSTHGRVTRQAVAPSPYYEELRHLEIKPSDIVFPPIEATATQTEDIEISYSELAAFLDCGMEFRLRNLMGFQPRLAPELGYGKAIHHVLRSVAERTRRTGRVPDDQELEAILHESFFLPTANKPAHRQLKDAARRLISRYTSEHQDDLFRVWETERPFELHLAGVTVIGRADVILDEEGGVPQALAIVDYKTSTSGEPLEHAMQLQIYADAGRREGLDVRAAYVHNLKKAERGSVDVAEEAVSAAEKTVVEAAERLRGRDYKANPGQRCRSCEVRTACGFAKR